MSTRGTTKAQIAVMALFAFSCFGLLTFLWATFGGAIPFSSKGYRYVISYPEATTLADQADVRVAGVSVGTVVALERDTEGNRRLATIEMDSQYAPVRRDARTTLRQKTLLGETYVELTLGSPDEPPIPENGRLAAARIEPTVELDEVLELFGPETRADFQRWQQNSAEAIRGRGRDFNDALGNVAGFADDGAGLLEVLEARRGALADLVRNTGGVFEALTRDEGQLRAFIVDSEQWLQATSSQRDNLAEAIQIMPTFLRESRATLTRLERFSVDTKPLVDDLGPVARDLRPTLADLRRAAPDLQTFFASLPAAVDASEQGLPELSRVLRGLVPVLDSTAPFLAQLNPILQWLQYQSGTVANFISMPGWALANRSSTVDDTGNGHILPQLIVAGTQTLVQPTRDPANRGNTYFDQGAQNNLRYPEFLTPPAWDCDNTTVHAPTSPRDPGCFVQDNHTFKGLSEKFPRVTASNLRSPDVNGDRSP